MLYVSVDIFKKYVSLMKYVPERPDEKFRIRLYNGVGVTEKT